ncbi:prephenate dehydratase [Boudabousia liubingyangii]|uniref:prephenate dehydratase n=1 Tax=Boudabousia liubingyangii TaxID=1921764 RepID=A0A1Q5PK74_9ACTO|nr:prephenate dehydratase [Boudabousia liubingyangii]OKL46620.1 prephenate dehydratase [Boudabousia liubingyangii]OKL46791.1 prephenate dehydratase [Boudabousia liubingyangii]
MTTEAQSSQSVKIAYLGPQGTFTELALRDLAKKFELDAEGLPCLDVPTALKKVASGEADRAVIPIENSVEGGVNASLDALARTGNLRIIAETVIPIDFCLVVRKGVKAEQVKRVGTHPHAWAQCRNWVAENFPGASHVPATSTAAAAELLTGDRYPGFEAALCNRVAAASEGLETLASGIADNSQAVTRFVMVAKPGVLPAVTGADKTTLQVRLPDNEAGALLSMLEQFSARGVNLSRIESRPAGGPLGAYEFSLDIEGHILEQRVQAALVGLHRTCPQVKFLGSYESASGHEVKVLPGTSDQAFEAANDWIASLTEVQ